MEEKEKRPLKKDCNAYFNDKANWKTVWEDKGAHLRLDLLNHTKCMRLVMTGFVPSEWIGEQDQVVAYSLDNRTADSLCGYLDRQPSQEEIRKAVYETWEEEK